MKFLIVALALISVCAAQSDADWERFQQTYGKSYRSVDEVASRRVAWEANWRKIKQHNQDYAKGLYTYTLGENEFADMTFEEFSKEKLGLKVNPNNLKADSVHEVSSKAVAKNVDLRKDDIVTDVKDQGRCGGCWSFAVISTVESLFIRVKNYAKTTDFSEQYLIDCSFGYLLGIIRRNNGCNGGNLEPTYTDIKTLGLVDEKDYKYIEADGTCKKPSVATNKIAGSVKCATEQAIIDAVEKKNTVAVGIHVSDKFQLYKDGIYEGDSTENGSAANHAVVVVGYSIDEAGREYYIIKNSWNVRWGEAGYFRLGYGRKNLKIDTMAYYPIF